MQNQTPCRSHPILSDANHDAINKQKMIERTVRQMWKGRYVHEKCRGRHRYFQNGNLPLSPFCVLCNRLRYVEGEDRVAVSVVAGCSEGFEDR